MILRNVVSTHGKDVHAIDSAVEAFAPLIFFSVHGHGTQTDPSAPHIQFLFPAQEGYFYLIQILFTVTVWPPELWMLYGHSSWIPAVCHNTAIRCCHFHMIAPCLIGLFQFFNLHVQMKQHFIGQMLLCNVYTVNSGFFHSQQVYRAEQSGIRKMCAPVPSKHTVRLTNVDKSIHGIF